MKKKTKPLSDGERIFFWSFIEKAEERFEQIEDTITELQTTVTKMENELKRLEDKPYDPFEMYRTQPLNNPKLTKKEL